MPGPNIVYILADDMGYGDLPCFNNRSQIPTPNLDRLAAQGMRFTDAHATSSVCSPSRYSLLSGQYNWRSRLKSGVICRWDGPVFEDGEVTVPSFLKSQGYDTACIGKWHLGWNWPTTTGRSPNQVLPYAIDTPEVELRRDEFWKEIDFSAPIAGGPIEHGFDTYFGVDVPNYPPYSWFQDDRLTAQPTRPKSAVIYGDIGPSVENWSHEAMLPEFTRRTVEYVESHSSDASTIGKNPFFLFLSLTAPHSPVSPGPEFRGRSGIGPYGDLVSEIDWLVGQVLDAVERSGLADDTLLIFTSDNGPELGTKDDEGAFERARRTGHYSMGDLRGIKHDVWEGGHRVPFIASWPGTIPSNTVCSELVSLMDLMATCADILHAPLPSSAGRDSISMLPLLQGNADQPLRGSLVGHSRNGKFSIRKDEWVFIDSPPCSENTEPEWFHTERGYPDDDSEAGLYNLTEDISQRDNKHSDQPEVAQVLGRELESVRYIAPKRKIAPSRSSPQS
ncbi:sulfatase family protein [Paenarthrobacter sp. 2TAF44]|uniref:sulfatase family protein n=1 Tax=Paenarthrobacter sp. 2TAF44 TaxID=3233018 RepID=UPI003F9D08A6